jgi:hypothetical protein
MTTDETLKVKWRSTHRVAEADITFLCDGPGCSKVADTVHFLPSAGGVGDMEPKVCLFACGDHDPGGYWLGFDRWTGAFSESALWDHIGKKVNGQEAQFLYLDRVEEYRTRMEPDVIEEERAKR